ncbi:MAG: hypothetical protein ACLFRT_05010 [Actinomycetota bacterium]
MTRRIAILLAGMALALAACGTSQNESPTTTTSAPAETTTTEPESSTTTTAAITTTTASEADGESSLLASLDAESTISSARVEGSFEMTGLDDSTTGVSEGVIVFSSAFDTETGDSEFVMDMSSFMDSVEIEDDDPFADVAAGMFNEIAFREVGDTAYVKFPFFTAMLGSETEWVSMPADEGDAFANDFETFPTDPSEIMENFDEEGASIEEVGTETVNGVEATHYRITLDPEAMDLSAEEEAELADSGILTTGVIPMDIWISEDGYMTRMVMVIDGTGLDSASGEEFETMTMTYNVFDVNAGVVIEEPPADQVTPMEDLEGAFDLEQ